MRGLRLATFVTLTLDKHVRTLSVEVQPFGRGHDEHLVQSPHLTGEEAESYLQNQKPFFFNHRDLRERTVLRKDANRHHITF